jgi:hypothetical protein
MVSTSEACTSFYGKSLQAGCRPRPESATMITVVSVNFLNDAVQLTKPLRVPQLLTSASKALGTVA